MAKHCYKTRDLKRLAESRGWPHARPTPTHFIFTPSGSRSVPIQLASKDLNPALSRKIIKALRGIG